MTRAILIVGGYGDVGGLLAAELVAAGHSVVVAGRNEDKARTMAASLGDLAGWCRVDVDDADMVAAALDGVAAAIGCIDQRDCHLLRGAVERGLVYVDVTAGRQFIEAGLALMPEACSTGARVLLGAGLTPGLINVMARACADAVGAAREVHTHGLFSAGDVYGRAALRFMLAAIPEPYPITDNGASRLVRCYDASKKVDFSKSVGARRVWRFAYPDQFFYPRTLGAHTSVSWFSLDPPWVGRLNAVMVGLGGRFFLRSRRVREGALRMFEAVGSRYQGQDALSFAVEVSGPEGTARATVSGHGEGPGTAISAALMFRTIWDGQSVPAGVWLPEQVIDVGDFFPAMSARGWHVEVGRT
ncbi:MAG: SDR family NAD(P)-dependent oxidoreductase [Myxococcota bacterium]|nr:SDR family NAD(P)-dependent oxidoreductase [Myxococcota bacterium]